MYKASAVFHNFLKVQPSNRSDSAASANPLHKQRLKEHLDNSPVEESQEQENNSLQPKNKAATSKDASNPRLCSPRTASSARVCTHPSSITCSPETRRRFCMHATSHLSGNLSPAPSLYYCISSPSRLIPPALSLQSPLTHNMFTRFY